MHDSHVVIVGAGIGGLATALALQQLAIRVSIYEQAPVLAEVGAGLTLASNGSKILLHLGLGGVLDDLA
ncbi:MAG: NAD(P)-binding protein, partial [Gammaproteobacteria bacterium]